MNAAQQEGKPNENRRTNSSGIKLYIFVCLDVRAKNERITLESTFSKLDGSEEEQRIGNAQSVSRETAEADEEARKRKKGKRRERQNMLFCARAIYRARPDPCRQPHGVSMSGICRPSEPGEQTRPNAII